MAQTIHDQAWITTSGLFTLPPFEVMLSVFGIDRVMFSVRLSPERQPAGEIFLDQLKPPAADLEKFTHGNADRLLKLKV